jgi:plasmid stability protein
MDKYIKRLQTRASRKGLSVTKTQVREVYTQVVTQPESPSEEEMAVVIAKLEGQYQAPSYEATPGELEISKPEVVEITPESDPSVWEKLQSLVEQPQPQEPNKMEPTTPAQDSSTLATTNQGGIAPSTPTAVGLTQHEIQQAVEQQFGKENIETKTAILNHVAQDTFATAQELQTALGKLRQMRLDILMKLIADHTQASGEDENLLKTALFHASANRQKETSDFFDSFENQLIRMRATFGI